MNFRTKLGCSLLLIAANQIYALNPTPGVYAGVIVGASGELGMDASYLTPFVDYQVKSGTPLGQRIQQIIDQQIASNPNRTLSLNYNILGLIGGQIGYRYDKFRFEGEFFYNSAPYKNFRISNGVDTLTLSNDDTKDSYIAGSTNTTGIMFNIFVDLLPPDYIDSNFAPFLGIGGGYARVQNNFELYVQGTQVNQYRDNRTQGAAAGQLMAGVLYFLDDFSNFGVDFRFFSTAKINPNIGQYGYSYNAQIASINLTFNGALNFG
jgi:hypothetical protein